MNMPGSKYERELRFIQTETRRLGNQLSKLREMMPVDPIEAARKADEVLGIEAEIGRLLQRKKEIEESFIAAGMEVPSMDKDMNENVHQDSRPFVGDEDESSPAPQIKPEGTVEELTEEIESVTDELMGIEIKMLRADMNGDEDEKQKLSMMASSLRSRRDTLVERVKELKAEAASTAPVEAQPTSVDLSEYERRFEAVESETRVLRSQIADVRSDVIDMKESLRQIMNALGIND